MSDYLVKATAANGMIRAFAATTKGIVSYAKNVHKSSRVVSAALGRLLTAGSIMGSMMKGEEDLLTLRIEGSGPMKGLIVTADSKGRVKGYPFVSEVLLPANEKGKLDVAKALGIGVLTVTADTGLKEPYVGQVELNTGEIAEDIAYYYAVSEQINSSVGLGVSFNEDSMVKQAGGFIIQLMPYCSEEVIETLEKNLANIKSVTELLDEGMTPEDILKYVMQGLEVVINEKLEIEYHCDCSRKRVEKALISVGKDELDSMIKEGKDVEVKCHFCDKEYIFTTEDIASLEALATK